MIILYRLRMEVHGFRRVISNVLRVGLIECFAEDLVVAWLNGVYCQQLVSDLLLENRARVMVGLALNLLSPWKLLWRKYMYTVWHDLTSCVPKQV